MSEPSTHTYAGSREPVVIVALGAGLAIWIADHAAGLVAGWLARLAQILDTLVQADPFGF